MPLAHETLEGKLMPHWELKRLAERVAIQKFCDDGLREELEKDLGRPASEQDMNERAAAVMAVFQCRDCKEPFCAGRVDCAESAQLDDTSSNSTRCPACEWTSSAHVNDHRCMVHGHRHAMFKCDSCCAVATWNCYSAHYCERCHNQAGEPKHYPCPGPDKCPLGMPHPPNQEAKHGQDEMASFCIGCTACLGLAEEPEFLDFNEKNVFGFPARKWSEFANGEAVLAEIGEEEVRARLRVWEPFLVAEQDVLSAVLCAEWLLPLELNILEAAEAAQRRQEEEERQDRLRREQEEEAELRREQEEEVERERLWIDIYREYASPPHVDDMAMLKSLQEENRVKATRRKATRQEHATAKEERRLRKRELTHSRGRVISPHQRYQAKCARLEVKHWEFDDAMECIHGFCF